jgi:3-oxoacyl-[acyl-carrier protein] reductase
VPPEKLVLRRLGPSRPRGRALAFTTFRNRTRAKRLVEEVAGVALRADLTSEVETENLLQTARDQLGNLDICVANVGVRAEANIPLSEMSLERWRSTIDQNLTAAFLTCRSYLRHVGITGSGSLVLVASTAAVFGEAGSADYAAAKAAIAYGLALSLKNEIVQVAPLGRVNVVAPGWTIKPMSGQVLDDAAIAHATATMSLSKVARPEDVASAIVWIASPTAAEHVSGQLITVAGGMEGRLLRTPSVVKQPDSVDELAAIRTDSSRCPRPRAEERGESDAVMIARDSDLLRGNCSLKGGPCQR